MSEIYDKRAPRKATNLSVNGDLLRKARTLDINLSAAFERALEALVKDKLARQWRAENVRAIADYNSRVDEHGVFSDGLRSF